MTTRVRDVRGGAAPSPSFAWPQLVQVGPQKRDLLR